LEVNETVAAVSYSQTCWRNSVPSGDFSRRAMARRRETLTPEEAEWEATREERTRWLYRKLNERWAETKAAEEARERAEREAAERATRRKRIIRRLIPFLH
jgi:hypothetical protein